MIVPLSKTKAGSGLQGVHAARAWRYETVIRDKYGMESMKYRCVSCDLITSDASIRDASDGKQSDYTVCESKPHELEQRKEKIRTNGEVESEAIS